MRNVLNVFIVCEADWMPRQGCKGVLKNLQIEKEKGIKSME